MYSAIAGRRKGRLAASVAWATSYRAASARALMYHWLVELDARVRELIDERLFEAYWANVEHYGTTDLVLFFNTELEVDPVTAFVRESLVSDPMAPRVLAQKVAKPAKDAATKLKGATAFWLIVSFPDEQMVITAVNAQRLGEGGAA